jgi:RimJ/RimL family protein N-acetyltransferase
MKLPLYGGSVNSLGLFGYAGLVDIEDVWRKRYRTELPTSRFLLRPLVNGDAAWIAELLADPEVCEFLWDRALEPAAARRLAESIIFLDSRMFHFGHWAVQDRDSGTVHGWTQVGKLRPWRGPTDEIALSYVLRRQSWGRGIATEAAGRLLRHVFEVHDLDRIMAVVAAGNAASERVLRKLGMQFVEERRTTDGKELRYFAVDRPPGLSALAEPSTETPSS